MFLCLSVLVPFLMSAADSTNLFSSVMQKELPSDVVEKVIKKSTQSLNGLTNGNSGKNVALAATIDYEVFKMGHNKLYTSWDNNYSIIFRVRVDLPEKVEYKDGWWIFASTKSGIPYLSYIRTDLWLDSLPTNYSAIQNRPESDKVISCFRESQEINTAHAGAYYTSNGGFYIDMLYYDTVKSGSSNTENTDLLYSSVMNLGTKGKNEHIVYNAKYDRIENHLYSKKTVFYYGSLSFKGDSDPNSLRLKFEIGYGISASTKSILESDDGSADIVNSSGLTAINTTYSYSNKTNVELKVI